MMTNEELTKKILELCDYMVIEHKRTGCFVVKTLMNDRIAYVTVAGHQRLKKALKKTYKQLLDGDR